MTECDVTRKDNRMLPAGRRPLHRDDSGATAVLAALTAPLLLAVAGLAAEGGMAYFKHAKLQSIADAAAMSAATAFQSGATVAQARLEAAAIVASLGYVDNDDAGISVTVNSPPASGPNTGNTQATEVLIALSQQPMLTRAFRSANYTIGARSVSIMSSTTDPGCVMALDPSGAGSLNLSGNPRVAANGCDVIVNSSSASALTGNGNGSLSAARLDIVGGVDLRGNVSVPSRRTLTAPVADPYASLTVPPAGGCNRTSPPSITNPVPSGVYCGGLTLKNGTFVLSGTYIVVGGDFDVSANANVTGTNVTIITVPDGPRAPSRPQIAANASLRISAPTSGPYAGVAFFATGGSASAPDSVTWNGTSNIDITGAIYMPHTNLTISGNVASQNAACTQILAWHISFQGNASIGANCSGTGTRSFGASSGTARVTLAD